METKEKKRPRKHKAWKIFFTVLLCLLALLLLLGIGGYFYLRHLYGHFTDPEAPSIVEEESSYSPELEPPSSDFVSEDPTEPSESGSSESSGSTSGGNSSSGGGGTTPPVIVTDDDLDVGNSTGKSVPIYKKEQIDPDIINLLFMGIDVEDFNKRAGRSDSMILISFNKKTGVVQMYSIMRDCLVPIKGHGWTKLNHSYAYGRAGLTINTINSIFDLDIQKYATIDWSGLKEIVNYLGGIEVPLTQKEINYYGWSATKKPGMNLLNGAEVRRHVANRTLGDDYARGRRQRDVLLAIYQKLMNERSLGEITDFLSFASGSVKTNISFEMMISYATAIFQNRDRIQIQSLQIPFKGTSTDGWYRCTEGWLAVVKLDIPDNRDKLHQAIYGS